MNQIQYHGWLAKAIKFEDHDNGVAKAIVDPDCMLL